MTAGDNMAAQQRWVTQQLDIDQKEVILIQDKIIRAGKEKYHYGKTDNRQKQEVKSKDNIKTEQTHQEAPKTWKRH